MHARPLAALALAAATAAAALAATTAGATQAPIEVTRDGVGAVTLGSTYQELRDEGLVGKMTTGCELAGPGTRAASLKRPLRGSVDFTRRGAPRVRNITITRGAEARGVGVGDTARALRRAFPGARFDHGTDETFGATLVTVPRRAGGKIQFLVGVDDRRVEAIGVPFIAFCE